MVRSGRGMRPMLLPQPLKEILADVVDILELIPLTIHHSCIRRDNHYTISPSSHANIKRHLPEMDDVVHGILAHRVSVGIEETECYILCQSTHTHRHRSMRRHTEVGARVNGQVDLVDLFLRIRSSLGSSNRALVVRITNLELIEIGGEWLQLGCFDLVIQSASFPSLRSINRLLTLTV